MSRTEKINQLIKQQLSQIINKEIDFPNNLLVTITRVETTPDFKSAKIYLTILPENLRGTGLEILRKNKKNLHNILKKQVKTKFTPNLNFLIDEQELYASKINRLLDEIK
jgi:ribosome-binding factor A